MHMRRCTQRPPMRRQSSHPVLDGSTSRTLSRCVQMSATRRLAQLLGQPLTAGLEVLDQSLLFLVIREVEGIVGVVTGVRGRGPAAFAAQPLQRLLDVLQLRG